MTYVYFIRHAEPNYSNHDDESRELTAKGLEDRKLVSEYLSDKKIDAVLSSPYKRAVDTVEHFAEINNLPVKTIYDFRERKVGNGWIDDFTDFTRRQWNDFSYKLSGGESLAEVQIRNIAALKEVLREYKDKNIAVGSHGTALSTIINYYESTFGYDDFYRIRELMPWIVILVFDGEKLQKIEKKNLFRN